MHCAMPPVNIDHLGKTDMPARIRKLTFPWQRLHRVSGANFAAHMKLAVAVKMKEAMHRNAFVYAASRPYIAAIFYVLHLIFTWGGTDEPKEHGA